MNTEPQLATPRISTQKAEVVPIILEPHDNADSLSIVKIWGYTVVVRTEDWLGHTTAVYITPDSLVDTTKPQFAFLADGKNQFARIKNRKLRGVISMGLLVPTPEGFNVGDDCADYLEVSRYEPKLAMNVCGKPGQDEAPPSLYVPSYDLETARKYGRLFENGELVFVTEKIHGENFRAVYTDGQFHVGSRTRWKKDGSEGRFWAAFNNTPNLKEFLEKNPDLVVFGESYGYTGGFPYDRQERSPCVRIFDMMRGGKWVDAPELLQIIKDNNLLGVPVLHTDFPFDFDKLCEMSDGSSLLNLKHIREGIVISPQSERWHAAVGRVKLKLVGNEYLGLKK